MMVLLCYVLKCVHAKWFVHIDYQNSNGKFEDPECTAQCETLQTLNRKITIFNMNCVF